MMVESQTERNEYILEFEAKSEKLFYTEKGT